MATNLKIATTRNIAIILIISSCTDSSFETEYYSDGKLKARYELRNGQRHGSGNLYYPDGKLQLNSTWENGIKQGQSISFYRNGQIDIKAEFVGGLQHGTVEKYDSSGVLLGVSNYRKGEKFGDFKEYDFLGKLKLSGNINLDSISRFVEYKNGVPYSCYAVRGDSIFYLREDDEHGRLKRVLLPLSIFHGDKICITLDYSMTSSQNLLVRLHLQDVSKVFDPSSTFHESSNRTICLEKQNKVLQGYFCEVDGISGNYISYFPVSIPPN